MPSLQDTYRRVVIRAEYRYRGVPPRDEWEDLTDLELEVAQALVEEFGEEAFTGSVMAQQFAMDERFAVLMVGLSDAFPEGRLTPDRIESVQQSASRAMAEFSLDAEDLLQAGTREGTRRAIQGQQQALNRTASQAGVSISDQAILDMMDRIRGRADARRTVDEDMLQIMRRNTVGANNAMRSWIRGAEGRPGRKAARQMLRRFSGGANFERIQNALDDLGPRGQAVRRAIQRAGRAAEDLQDEASNLYVNAKRTLVHEQNVAFHEADVLAMEESPAVRVVRWRTSARHPSLRSSPDVCSVASEANIHGFGPGLYHPGSAPSLFHPWCECGVFPVTVDPDEWGNIEYDEKQVPNRKPDVLDANEVGQILRANLTAASGPVTANKIARSTRVFRTKTQVAYDAFVDF